MVNKARILHVTESSYLSTGYSKYSSEVLSRLHATGKFEIAELGVYGEPNDRRNASVPWKFYHNVPVNDAERQIYERNQTNQFGEWKFEEVALDFRPDCIFDARDHWMCEFEQRSPFRPFYHWTVMPACDAEPQSEQWIETYMQANSVFSYSDWGLETLRRQSCDRMKLVASAPPGADLEAFQPFPKRDVLRKQMGL